MARVIAPMALVALGFSGGPVHNPVHARWQASSSHREPAYRQADPLRKPAFSAAGQPDRM
jgi:hypothetical protein